MGGTYFARFDMLLDPGIYYVKVELSNREKWAMEAPYSMHLIIEESDSTYGPTAPEIELTPENPMTTQDLVCEITEESISESGSEISYFYVWFRDGVVVPFGNAGDVNPWETVRYNLSMAKNNIAGEDPWVIPSAYTNPGEKWHCEVYARDQYGYSETPVASNVVTIGSELGRSWNMELVVNKEFRGQIGFADDQIVTLGWHDLATHGFDASLDAAIPALTVPAPGGGTIVLPLGEGRSYSAGFDNAHTSLSVDYRPYGKASSWFVIIEMGDPLQDSIAECRLSWQVSSMPEDMVDGISITQMRKRVDGVFEAIPGTQQMVAAGNVLGEIVLDEIALKDLQTDSSGQAFAVFRVSIGAPDEFQVFDFGVTNAATWKPGWQLVSLKLTPLNNAIEELFTQNGQKLYRGIVWMYEGGKYVPATHMVAGRGYWMYIPKKATSLINLYGNLGTSIPLNAGWNICGPIYDIEDFKATYNDTDYPGVLKKIVKPENDAAGLQIYKFIIDNQGNPGYGLAQDGTAYHLTIGNGYWIEVTETFELPVVTPKENK